MRIDDFSFELPAELIAQEPAHEGRDQSRLMVLNRQAQTIAHRRFFELPDLLQPGDLLVLNDSKVFPGRIKGVKAGSGAKVELLLLHELEPGVWDAMVKSRRTRENDAMMFEGETGLKGRIRERISDATWRVELNQHGDALPQTLSRIGMTPIPPYVKKSHMGEQALREKYQTVYAREEGSAAAPTAGLHFTKELLQTLAAKDIQTTVVTLHVGLGTFLPVREDNILEHKMHAEFAEVSEETARTVNEARAVGRRIIAVGTTSVRTLESFMKGTQLQAGSKWTDIFIYPGYKFRCVDGVITNFHLPRSTLLMLVSAFAGLDFTKTAYRQAVEQQYRFYSFGDAMLIL